MNYTLKNKPSEAEPAERPWKTLWQNLSQLLADEKRALAIAFVGIFLNAALNICAPLLIGHAVDTYVQTKQYQGVLMYGGILLIVYLLALVSGYVQTRWMGGVGQRVLFKLRNAIFTKLQELPVAFFTQNKAGDLISRINNDTDKLNMFFSQSLMQLVGSLFIMLGAGIFLLSIHGRLGLAALAPAAFLLVLTQILSPWVKRQNTRNLQSVGGMSSEIQESLQNFKVIVAFNRRDYFRKRFQEVNESTYVTSMRASLANAIFTPLYGLSANLAQLIVLAYGIYLITQGSFTLGLLISFLSYIHNFYTPLRQLAALWSSFQVALAGWERVSEILSLKTDLVTVASSAGSTLSQDGSVLSFKDVAFRYPDGKEVIKHVSFDLEKGKTYALVGPTGGGKTTTASLMARLYDATEGGIFLHGKDIRCYSPAERAQKIGFILQEPFLFSGTIGENLVYGNDQCYEHSKEQLIQAIDQAGLTPLIQSFEKGLDTPVTSGGDGLSVGERQLIAFMRAVLRRPDVLILDEATANIDTVTEQKLERVIKQLPKGTVKVIIAHRLNTIEEADEIFFVNGGQVTPAGSLEHAVEMLMQGKRTS